MIKKISKYRNALMGIAILWIMIHHSGLCIPNPFFVIKRTGYCGVEIFLFLSGLGCAYSLNKNSDRFEFYSRRLKRIYPHYLPILIPFFIVVSSKMEGTSVVDWIRDILGNITCISFWSMQGYSFNWYIPGIIAFYLMTPLFYEAIIRYQKKGLFFLLAVSFVAGLCFARSSTLLTAISRFPIYILGVYAGILLVNSNSEKEKKQMSWKMRIIIYISGIVGFVILGLLHKYKDTMPVDFYNVFYPCILISFAIICFFCQVFELLDKVKVGKAIIKIFEFIGKISLDIYLIHIVFFTPVGMLIEGSFEKVNPKPFSISNFIIWTAIIVSTIFVSFVYNKVISLVSNKCAKSFASKERS